MQAANYSQYLIGVLLSGGCLKNKSGDVEPQTQQLSGQVML